MVIYLKGINKAIDFCLIVLSSIAALALGFLLVAICYATFSRFAFNKPLSNLVEYASYSLIYITFLGAPQILKNRGHINLDILTNTLAPKVNLMLSVAVNIAGAVICGVITWISFQVAYGNFVNQIKVMDSMGTPQYLLTMAIPIGMFFMTVQFIRNTAQDFNSLKISSGGGGNL